LQHDLLLLELLVLLQELVLHLDLLLLVAVARELAVVLHKLLDLLQSLRSAMDRDLKKIIIQSDLLRHLLP